MWITPILAALLGLLFFFLSIRVIRLRRRLKVALGDGGHTELQRAMRVQANFSEYVPLILVLIALLEGQGAPGIWIWLFGSCLLLGRLVHGYGVSRSPEPFKLRVIGMGLTFFALFGSCLALLLLSLSHVFVF